MALPTPRQIRALQRALRKQQRNQQHDGIRRLVGNKVCEIKDLTIIVDMRNGWNNKRYK